MAIRLSAPVFLPGDFHGQRNLAGYCLWDCKESDMTEHVWLTHTHTHTHKAIMLWTLTNTMLYVNYSSIKLKKKNVCHRTQKILNSFNMISYLSYQLYQANGKHASVLKIPCLALSVVTQEQREKFIWNQALVIMGIAGDCFIILRSVFLSLAPKFTFFQSTYLHFQFIPLCQKLKLTCSLLWLET